MMQPKTKTILFIIFSFLLGVLVGWFVQDRIFTKPMHKHGDFQKMLTERLHLNETQIMQLDSVLEMRKQKMEEQRKQILSMRDSVQSDIRKLLNADQVKLFDEIIREFENKEGQRREREQK
jgi:hypothetical protein